MNIYIEAFDVECVRTLEPCAVEGMIQIGDYEETLYIPLNWWSLDDYKKQWRDGFDRLTYYDKSCLIVAVNNPNISKFIEWWVLYKVKDKIYIQNHIFMEEVYHKRLNNEWFTAKTCYRFIPDRGEPYDEDGNKISEWVIE